MSFTIGSLFDGSGGFPLAASLCGGTPKWASEIEPYPIAVTKSRFPNVKHLGSVTDIKGGEVEPVDVITFGSPCQDLSVAGKRAGLKHEANGDEETTRSGLFMEAVRIIKEMREATNGVYPRFALWENVPGAFSSNNGEDFRIVLQELIQVAEPTAVMPEVPKNGWPYADSYCGDGWSIAYRVLDAQFWGVPQRRRRIYLVADFRGECAGKVSFEREGLRGYFETGRTPWQTVTGNAETGFGATDCERNGVSILNPWDSQGNQVHDGTENHIYPCLRGCGGAGYQADYVFAIDQQGGKGGANYAENVMPTICSDSHGTPHAVAYTLKIRSGCEGGGKGALIQEDISATLATNNDQYLFQPICLEPGIAAREGGHIYEGISGTLRANAGDNQMAVAHMVLDDQGGSQISVRDDGKSPTLRAEMHGNVPCVMNAVGVDVYNQALTWDKAKTLNSAASDADHIPCVLSIENHSADSRVNIDESGKVQTLTSRMGTGGGNVPMVLEQKLASGKDVTGCLMASGYDKLGAQEMFSGDYTVIEKQTPVYCLQGGGATSQNSQGMGYKANTSYTLNTTDLHAVAYWDGGQTMATLTANNAGGNQRMPDKENFNCVIEAHSSVACTDVGWLHSEEDTAPTLLARMYKDPHLVSYSENAIRYIVRRLTPTECARLQGFPDTWGHPDVKTELTEEEYQFWMNVRNTHAAINDKATKEYTKEQILKWYNGLHTDSSEYKMWGNGIALPNALYMMQGIADVMSEEKEARRKWLKDLLGDCL